MTRIFESTIEEFVIELLQNQGWKYLSPEEQELERLPNNNTDKPDLAQVVLKKRLKHAIDELNPNIPEEAKDQALLNRQQRSFSPHAYRRH